MVGDQFREKGASAQLNLENRVIIGSGSSRKRKGLFNVQTLPRVHSADYDPICIEQELCLAYWHAECSELCIHL